MPAHTLVIGGGNALPEVGIEGAEPVAPTIPK